VRGPPVAVGRRALVAHGEAAARGRRRRPAPRPPAMGGPGCGRHHDHRLDARSRPVDGTDVAERLCAPRPALRPRRAPAGVRLVDRAASHDEPARCAARRPRRSGRHGEPGERRALERGARRDRRRGGG
jgi:hypothetical protein